jgi:hypothetical protein
MRQDSLYSQGIQLFYSVPLLAVSAVSCVVGMITVSSITYAFYLDERESLASAGRSRGWFDAREPRPKKRLEVAGARLPRRPRGEMGLADLDAEIIKKGFVGSLFATGLAFGLIGLYFASVGVEVDGFFMGVQLIHTVAGMFTNAMLTLVEYMDRTWSAAWGVEPGESLSPCHARRPGVRPSSHTPGPCGSTDAYTHI